MAFFWINGKLISGTGKSVETAVSFHYYKPLTMNILESYLDELRKEYRITRKFLENFPDDQVDYSPHEKSTKLGALANHIVDIFSWPGKMSQTDKIDFANPPDQQSEPLPDTSENLLNALKANMENSEKFVPELKEEDLEDTWGLYNGEHELASWSKYGAMRHAISQITHHRAQLGVYYRLLGIPVPSSYGPSADEQTFD